VHGTDEYFAKNPRGGQGKLHSTDYILNNVVGDIAGPMKDITGPFKEAFNAAAHNSNVLPTVSVDAVRIVGTNATVREKHQSAVDDVSRID